MQVELATQGRLVMYLEPAAQAQLEVHLQEAEEQPPPSEEGTRSHQSANALPDAKWSGPYRRISPDNRSANETIRVARRIVN